MTISHGTIHHDERNGNQWQQGSQRRRARQKDAADEGSQTVDEEDG